MSDSTRPSVSISSFVCLMACAACRSSVYMCVFVCVCLQSRRPLLCARSCCVCRAALRCFALVIFVCLRWLSCVGFVWLRTPVCISSSYIVPISSSRRALTSVGARSRTLRSLRSSHSAPSKLYSVLACFVQHHHRSAMSCVHCVASPEQHTPALPVGPTSWDVWRCGYLVVVRHRTSCARRTSTPRRSQRREHSSRPFSRTRVSL